MKQNMRQWRQLFISCNMLWATHYRLTGCYYYYYYYYYYYHYYYCCCYCYY
jgi:hypothetical protein